MPDGLTHVAWWQWLLAVLPILVLVVLVVRNWVSTTLAAALTTLTAVAVAAVVFGADAGVLAVAAGKGVWTGLWILYVIWPALLLYQIARRVGFDRMGGVLSSLLPRRVETVLLVAWVFPSFVQGVAGFGTPIAVAAPLLLSLGVGKVRAVALPLIGYHWSVTFGSMGSSFYMGALTAGLVGAGFDQYARDAALILGVNVIVAGILVCLMYGGTAALREGGRMLAVCGLLMAVTLFVSVGVEPAIGSLSAGAAGFLGVLVLRAWSGRGTSRMRRPVAPIAGGAADVAAAPVEASTSGSPSRPVLVVVPYAYLLVLVLMVFLPPAARAFAQSHLVLGPSFPQTMTAAGFVNAPVAPYTPIALLSHPGSYILAATLLGLLTYRLAGMWPRGALPGTLHTWFGQVRRASLSVIALTTLATVMVDAGMVRTIAVGAAEVTGALFPAVSPIIGSLGSFTTGSTTTSNALFSALQRDVATLIGVSPSKLLAAQTAGGNVGNAFAPVIILIGATAVGAREHVSDVFRTVAKPVAVLLGVVVALTFVLVSL